MKSSIALKPCSSLSADDLLFSSSDFRVPPGFPLGRLDRKVAVTVGAKALGKLGRELGGLSQNATCTPGKKRGEYFFDVVDGTKNIGIIPISRIEAAILRRLQDGAASFQATVTKLEWKEVQYSVQLVVQLTPVSKN